MYKKNRYSTPEAEETLLRLKNDLLSFSDGAPDVNITVDDEDNTFA